MTAVVFLLTFGAFAGIAQTLTGTFQFVGSGTVGTQSFTNANITITTVGFTGNVSGSLASGFVYLTNYFTSILVVGAGTFQFAGQTFIDLEIAPSDAAPGTLVAQDIFFAGPEGQYLVWVTSTTTNPWNLLGTFGFTTPSGATTNWNRFPIITSDGYTLNLYSTSAGWIPVAFQAVLTPGVPCAGTQIGNVADVRAVINESLGAAQADADINGDSVVNVVDVQLVTNAVLGCWTTTSGTTPAMFRMRAVPHRSR
jgi:hypothetical protein